METTVQKIQNVDDSVTVIRTYQMNAKLQKWLAA